MGRLRSLVVHTVSKAGLLSVTGLFVVSWERVNSYYKRSPGQRQQASFRLGSGHELLEKSTG